MTVDLAFWKKIGLIVCFGFFAAILLWLGLTRRSRFDAAARLPLAPDDPPRTLPTQERHHG